jgi:hypothetical protein
LVGDDDIATVFDPFGTVGSTPVSGASDLLNLPGSFDLAAVFGDGFSAFPDATGGNFLIDILPTSF